MGPLRVGCRHHCSEVEIFCDRSWQVFGSRIRAQLARQGFDSTEMPVLAMTIQALVLTRDSACSLKDSMDLPVPSAVCGSVAAAATVNWPSSAGISKLTWSNADVHGDWKATTYTLIASLVLGSKLLRRGQSHGPARSVKAAGCGRSGTRREHIFLDVVAAAVAAGPSAAAAKGGNPFLLVQDGEEAFRKNRVEESIDLFDSAAESGYPKARLWQRGLSLYYAKDFTAGSQQFRKDVEMNPNDTEESIWAFLCDAQMVGFDEARKQILKVGVDPRPVMRTAMALFRGDDDTKYLAALEDLSAGSGSDVFYSCLYLGLYYEAKGDVENARRYLLKATSCRYGKGSTDYMADLARVHVARRGWGEVEF